MCRNINFERKFVPVLVLLALFVPALVLGQPSLLDPATQPKFVNDVPDALAPGFHYTPTDMGSYDYYEVGMYQIDQPLGLIDPVTGDPLVTRCWGYGTGPGFPNATYPGRTFTAQRDRQVQVQWSNNLTVDGTGVGAPLPHLLPVDETLHWAYALPGYDLASLATDGVPVVPHLHGGHTEWQSDGNPEYFFTPGERLVGPRFVKSRYVYDNSQEAGTLWYHDHGLGITRLNVYAGLAGFYILRDEVDTGAVDNPLGLPTYPYEQALVIQDHMFDADGQHFYPAFPGDPLYDDFIDPDVDVDPTKPSALAEFFGDFILVNGVPWPKMEVEPRVYRFRLLNGSDSRFYNMKFSLGPVGNSDHLGSRPPEFVVIGSDDGLLESPVRLSSLLFAPGERYDVLIDFSNLAGRQLIITNNANGPYPDGDPVDPTTTGKIMAFNVGGTVTSLANNRIPASLGMGRDTAAKFAGLDLNNLNTTDKSGANFVNVRKLALFEGRDDKGRLQPLLGTAAPARDVTGGLQDGALVWDECQAPITENPALGATEIWEVYNGTGDAHPFHVHLVSFRVLDRQDFIADVLPKEIVQHDGSLGMGFRFENIVKTGRPELPKRHERGPKDTVIMQPDHVTRIIATFDRPGRYVYHCHILSHEDHEMMRPYHVGPWDPALDMTPCHHHGQLAEKELPQADALLALQSAPNPFNPMTKVSYKLPADSHVHLLVYDISGRLVRVLAEGNQIAGAHEVLWDGKDRSGAQVSSGTYFARLESSSGTAVQKLVMLK